MPNAPAWFDKAAAEIPAFDPGSDSPTKQPLLIVGNEISGSITVFQSTGLRGKR